MKPLVRILISVALIVPLTAHAQEENVTDIPLGQQGETKLIHVSPNQNFPREGLIKYSTPNDRLKVNLKPGRYFYRFRSNSNAQRAVSKSGKIIVEPAAANEAPKTDYSIKWTPPIDNSGAKVPFFWSVTDAKGNFVIKDQVIVEENPAVQLLHPGTYYWTLTDEIGASWTIPQQFFVNPFPPSSVQAIVNQDRTTDISWKASPTLESFIVKITDQEGYQVLSTTLNDHFLSIPELPPGQYKVDVHGTISMTGRYGLDAEPNFNLTSKPISTSFEMPEGENKENNSPLVILSPVDRINFEGQKYIFSWHVKGKNPAKKYRLQVRAKDPAGNFSDVALIETANNYDETIFHTLPLGQYKFRVSALNEKGEQIPGLADKAEFSIESKIGEARIGRVALNNAMFGPDAGMLTYTSTTELSTNTFTTTPIGLFFRHENTGASSDQQSFPYTLTEIRSQFFTQSATTMTHAELTYGVGQFTSASQSGWITKYGLWGSLQRTPDIVGGTTAQLGHLNFVTLRPRLEFGRVSKHFNMQLGFEGMVPLFQLSDQLTLRFDPLQRVALGYRATFDMQFPFFWPWSAGGQVAYEKNAFHYLSPQASVTTDSSLTGFTVKLYFSYPY